MLASKTILRGGALPIVSRNFSVPKARTLYLSSGSPFRLASAPLSRIRFAPSLTAVRFNSSITPSPSASTDTTPPPDTPGFADDLIPKATDALSSAADAVQPDTMGYLHSLGIDFGWGTTTCIQHLLESMHVYTGLPWWGTTMASILLIRAAQFPFYCIMSSNAARMKELSPFMGPITDKMKMAQKAGDTMQMLELRKEMKDLLKVSGVNRLWLVFPITQIPIFYGFYKTLYAMAEVKVPGLATQGLGWIQDWSVADPYLILPATASALVGVQILIGGESGANNIARTTKIAMAAGFPLISFVVTYSWPAALGFYFSISGVLGLLQAFLLKQKWFREAAGLYPLSFEQSINPLARKSTLNIARPKAIDVTPRKKQIGTSGGLLDKLTGGKDDPHASWSLSKLTETSKEKQKAKEYKEYEARRKERLEQEKKAAQLERESRARMKQS